MGVAENLANLLETAVTRHLNDGEFQARTDSRSSPPLKLDTASVRKAYRIQNLGTVKLGRSNTM